MRVDASLYICAQARPMVVGHLRISRRFTFAAAAVRSCMHRMSVRLHAGALPFSARPTTKTPWLPRGDQAAAGSETRPKSFGPTAKPSPPDFRRWSLLTFPNQPPPHVRGGDGGEQFA